MKEDGDTRRAHACRVLERQCVRLSRLLEDLLMIAQEGSDITMFRKEGVDLNRVLVELTEAFQPLVALKEQHLDVLLSTRRHAVAVMSVHLQLPDALPVRPGVEHAALGDEDEVGHRHVW
jgi:signal transduction histidine kinase